MGRRLVHRLSQPLLLCAALAGGLASAPALDPPSAGLASWYGERHRGKLMANGQRFDPDRLTAASWVYPLGTRVRVILEAPDSRFRSVQVTITDRGPARELVREGRIIDLSRAAFRQLADLRLGLIPVRVEAVN